MLFYLFRFIGMTNATVTAMAMTTVTTTTTDAATTIMAPATYDYAYEIFGVALATPLDTGRDLAPRLLHSTTGDATHRRDAVSPLPTPDSLR